MLSVITKATEKTIAHAMLELKRRGEIEDGCARVSDKNYPVTVYRKRAAP